MCAIVIHAVVRIDVMSTGETVYVESRHFFRIIYDILTYTRVYLNESYSLCSKENLLVLKQLIVHLCLLCARISGLLLLSRRIRNCDEAIRMQLNFNSFSSNSLSIVALTN